MKENWKEEFDKLVESFDDWSGDSDGNEHYCPNPDWKKVKSFIENLLEQEKKRMSDEIGELYPTMDSNEARRGYDQARADILSIINK